MCDVSCEVSILVALFIVPSVNIPLSRTCELIKVGGFHLVVNNHNIWLLRSVQCNFASSILGPWSIYLYTLGQLGPPFSYIKNYVLRI